MKRMKKIHRTLEPCITVFCEQETTYRVVVKVGESTVRNSFKNLSDARDYRNIAVRIRNKIHYRKRLEKLKQQAMIIEDLISGNMDAKQISTKYGVSYYYVSSVLTRYFKPIGGYIITKQSRV